MTGSEQTLVYTGWGVMESFRLVKNYDDVSAFAPNGGLKVLAVATN